ncbi:MAG: acetolactate synthase [Candidatus Bathyarchaeia archaeon]
MPVPQVSVFLDNRPGSLSQVMGYLDKLQIKIFALSIADAGEYGLIRMITEDPERSAKILEDAEFNLAKSKKNTEVTAILITEKNPISKITKILGENAVNIEYAYTSAVHMEGRFALVLRPKEVEKAEKTLRDNGIAVLTLEEIKTHFQQELRVAEPSQ